MPTEAIAPPSATFQTPLGRISYGWATFVVLFLGYVGFILATMRAGVGSDPGIANPSPGAEPYWISPFLEPVPFAIVSLGQVALLFGVLLWLSWRQRRLHWTAIMALGAVFTGIVDPLANWATFASLNPEVPHLPTDWPWIRLAPLSEPVAAFLGGYASYYLAIGGLSYLLARKMVRRLEGSSEWIRRRPLLALFVGAWVISFPMNALFQLSWMAIGMLVYTQFAGPTLDVAHLRLPFLILLYDPFVYATQAILCVRNDHGESAVLARLAPELPQRAGHPGNTSGRQVVVAGTLMIASILAPISGFAAIRGLGLADNVVYEQWPFPETSVYDPYGLLEAEGEPGPFHD